MSNVLTHRAIKSLCGRFAYEKGAAYYRTRKVTFTRYDAEADVYAATVKANSTHQVAVTIERNGDVTAECTCPKLHSYDTYCQHVAAVLLNIHALRQEDRSPYGTGDSAGQSERERVQIRTHTGGSGTVNGDIQLTNRILGLFTEAPIRQNSTRAIFDARTQLDVEIICRPVSYGYRSYMLGIELKVGPKRLYVVQKIRDFLNRVERREPHVFTRLFTYDPEQHSFAKEADAVLQKLMEIYRSEKLYRDTSQVYAIHANSVGGERILLIPPFFWDSLLPLLVAAPTVKLEQGNHSYDGIQLSTEPLPLHFAFDQAKAGGFRLDVQGLDEITVLDAYGVVLVAGKLVKLPPEQCKRLYELQRMLETARTQQIQISLEQIEPFMGRVIPGLMKLGRVHIAQAVSDRVLQTALQARLYLDRVRDRLLAGLEFQYGDIVINPLEGSGHNHGSDRILMRDGEQEREILELMEQSGFTKTESGYYLENEEAEYDFLHHIVPRLEKLLKVYATTAVKVRLIPGHVLPKATVDVDERTDWLEFSFEMDGIPESEIRHVLKSLEEKRRYHRLPNGALLPLESEQFQEIIRSMNELGISEGELAGARIRLPVVRGLHLLDSRERGSAVRLGKAFRKLLENMRNPDNLDFPVPATLAHVLRDYQRYGFEWMKTLAHYRFGGILADDMGLGKTLQSIAFIVSCLEQIRDHELPALIVSPASLVYNWQNELKKFAPELRTVIVDGSKTDRVRVLQETAAADVIITSYPLLRRDIEQYAEQSFHTLILDEAQFFKNHATQTAHAVKAIKARYRFALTGTPVENRLEELWSIFDAVFPELFTNRKAFHNLSRDDVAKRIRPFLLRRVKTDVLKELPEKIESLQASKLLPEQKKLYVAYLAKLQQETVKHLSEDGFQKHRIKILAGLTRLRQLICHPALFVEDYTGSSAKLEQLFEVIQECRSAGGRMLIFSQFTEMLRLIAHELGHQGVPFFYLDGSTPSAERVELCNRFNEGERELFLMSLKAGGTGLNLTGADTVILYDLWWNPAVEQQAADRAHRIGQKKVVQVIRLVAQGTVEEKMYELQQKKKHLIEEVIQPGQEELSSLTEQELREILSIAD